MEEGALTPKLVLSDDGSHTLKVEGLKEHYHSHKGAIKESDYVFIQMGLHQFPNNAALSIFEMGFGTGLNVLMTAINAGERKIQMTSIESNPLDMELIEQLNYPSLVDRPETYPIFKHMHETSWSQFHALTDRITLKKVQTKLEDFNTDDRFDLVYYDAFAPHAQPELWTMEIWNKLYGLMSDRAMLVTYCAKGQVRRDLQSAGFEVERLPGPPGKREMLRAKKD